jgi:replicative DNA helicase
MSDREMPWSKDSEQAVLGAILLAPRLLTELADTRVDDFMLPQHRDVLEAMRAVEAVDAITVADEMTKRGTLSRLQGQIAYFSELANKGSDVMFPHHLGIIREKALARRLIAACLETASRAYGGAPVTELVADQRVNLAGLELDGKEGGPVRIADSIDAAIEYIDQKSQNPDRYTISTGLADFDHTIGGARAGHLVIVAGLPGMGKTSFAENVAIHNGARRTPVLIFSLEMKRQELIERALSAGSRIDGRKIVSARLDVDDWKALGPAAEDLRRSWVWIDDRKLATSRICAEAMRWREKTRRLKRKENPDADDRALVVIDYLGLVRVDARGENRNLEVAAMTGAFKALAGDLDCPVMLLSQLNRSSAKDRRKPIPSDLRDSGAVEADADMIIFPWRDEPDNVDKIAPPEYVDATIIVAKHRNGPVGEVPVVFHPSTTRFLDRDHDRWKGAPNAEFPAHYTDPDR